MKVIIQGYNTCCQNKAGGVQTRLRKIASLLKERGVDVELFNPFESDISTCDVLHVFSLNVENWGLIQCAKKQSKLVVMSAVVPTTEKIKLTLYKWLHILPIYTNYSMRYESLQMTDVVIVETQAEAEFLHLFYSVPKNKMVIIPNGVDDANYQGDEIFNAVGKHCDYILQVGRFDENKNQLNVIRAMKDSGIDIVFIGGSNHSEHGYYQKCESEAKGCNNFHLLGWQAQDSDILKSAYANAKLVILPSHYETFGLVLLEGGFAGANLAISKTLPILCYSSFNDCVTFNPDDINDIKKNLIKAFGQPKDRKLKDKLKAEFNWDKIIEQHISIYEKCR